MIFSDEFLNDDINKKWDIDCVNGSQAVIENNKLMLKSGSYWCGLYLQPKVILNPKMPITIEYDYEILSAHYKSADKPYIAFVSAKEEYNRDKRYNMIQESADRPAIFIYLADNYDSNSRSKFSVSYKNKILVEKQVDYPINTKLHIKIEIDSENNILRFYTNNESIPLLECNIYDCIKEMGCQWKFEINSNSYGYFLESYDNFSIKYSDAKFLLKQNTTDNLLSFKDDMIINLGKQKVEEQLYKERGFRNVCDLNDCYEKINMFRKKEIDRKNNISFFRVDIKFNINKILKVGFLK